MYQGNPQFALLQKIHSSDETRISPEDCVEGSNEAHMRRYDDLFKLAS